MANLNPLLLVPSIVLTNMTQVILVADACPTPGWFVCSQSQKRPPSECFLRLMCLERKCQQKFIWRVSQVFILLESLPYCVPVLSLWWSNLSFYRVKQARFSSCPSIFLPDAELVTIFFLVCADGPPLGSDCLFLFESE